MVRSDDFPKEDVGSVREGSINRRSRLWLVGIVLIVALFIAYLAMILYRKNLNSLRDYPVSSVIKGSDNGSDKRKLSANVLLKVKVIDYISQLPIKGVSFVVEDKKFISSDQGEIEITGLLTRRYKGRLLADGYIEQNETIEPDKLQPSTETTFQLVPKGKVVFVSNRDGKRGIYIVNYDGSEERRLVKKAEGSEDYDPLVSPDRKYVAFLSNREIKQNSSDTDYAYLYLVKLDNKNEDNLRRISDDLIESIRWSPNGRYIVWTGKLANETESPDKFDTLHSTSMMAIYNVQTNKTVKFTAGPNSSFGDVSFNQNGTQLAFYKYSPNAQEGGTYVVGSDGNNLRRILDERAYILHFNDDDNLEMAYFDNDNNRYGVWFHDSNKIKTKNERPKVQKGIKSPNGLLRAYIEQRDGRRDVFVSELNGTKERRLTETGKVTAITGWSNNSQYVIFLVKGETKSSRYAIAVNGKVARKITDEN